MDRRSGKSSKNDPMSWGGLVPDDRLKSEKNKARELRRSQWWKRQTAKGICYYCHCPTPPRELTMDHVVPMVRGGKTTKGNVVPACKSCNTKKKELLPLEWAEYLKNLQQP